MFNPTPPNRSVQPWWQWWGQKMWCVPLYSFIHRSTHAWRAGLQRRWTGVGRQTAPSSQTLVELQHLLLAALFSPVQRSRHQQPQDSKMGRAVTKRHIEREERISGCKPFRRVWAPVLSASYLMQRIRLAEVIKLTACKPNSPKIRGCEGWRAAQLHKSCRQQKTKELWF